MIRTPRSRWLFTLAILALAGCQSAGPTPAPDAAATAPNASDLAFYDSVLDKVHAAYVDPVSDSTLIDKSLKGMLTGLDPHSDFLNEHEYQDMLDDSAGEFAGIGAELTQNEDHPVVLSPIDDTPAARAGIK